MNETRTRTEPNRPGAPPGRRRAQSRRGRERGGFAISKLAIRLYTYQRSARSARPLTHTSQRGSTHTHRTGHSRHVTRHRPPQRRHKRHALQPNARPAILRHRHRLRYACGARTHQTSESPHAQTQSSKSRSRSLSAPVAILPAYVIAPMVAAIPRAKTAGLLSAPLTAISAPT